MNKERLLELADIIEKAPPEEFDMQDWCGTACCIAGWAVKVYSLDASRGVRKVAGDVLWLSKKQSEELFTPDLVSGYDNVKNIDAANVLRKAAISGRIKWNRAELLKRHRAALKDTP